MTLTTESRYSTARSKYSASLMSNAKWIKLFRAVLNSSIEINHAEWRYIDSPTTEWKRFPKEQDLGEKGFLDGLFQPYEYRWIESIFIPSSYRPAPGVGLEKSQDTSRLQSVLSEVGQFPIFQQNSGVVVLAYRK